jgi:hypothetical protein
MITESYITSPTWDAEAIKAWYFSSYHPFAYESRLVSTIDNPDGTQTLTFSRAKGC